MKSYKICKGDSRNDDSMIIRNRETGTEIAEYRTDNYDAEARRMRRVIDTHLASGGTLGNYQW